MYLSIGLKQQQFTSKQIENSNYTTDAQSRQEQPFYHWQPLWFDLQNRQKYPHAHTICPNCSKSIISSSELSACQNPEGKLYLCHSPCTTNIFQFTQYTHTAKITYKQSPIPTAINHKIGTHQYLIQFSLQHPISPHKFYYNYIKILEYQKKLIYSTTQSYPSQYLSPNYIIIPMKQFKCNIKIIALNDSQENIIHTLYFRVDLSRERCNICSVQYRQNSIGFVGEFQIIEELTRKKQIVQNMNYKYRRPYQQENFVKFNNFYIKLDDTEPQENPQTNIIEENYDMKRTQQPQFDQQSKYPLIQTLLHPLPPPSIHQTKTPQKSFPIDTQFLSSIKTQTGSKQFQKRVKSLKNQQIQQIITKIIPHLQQIILNQYANYMFQSLLSTCTFQQRKKIIQNISNILTKLVCQQQGTFVFQQLIIFLINQQQFLYLCTPVAKDFHIIAKDNYGNHFLRKLIQNVPKCIMCEMFMPKIYEYFEEFAKNKNAVCVMKSVIKSLVEGTNQNKQIYHQIKKFIYQLTLSIKNLIYDQYGNYLIQQIYQLLQYEKLSGITQYIINSFINLSCQKFSSNVLLNCIKKYWRPNNIILEISKHLKKKLDNRNISYMYQNKEGNKILLELMELPLQLTLKDKIHTVVRYEQPSKYHSRRWVTILGKPKTATTTKSTTYTTFSQAVTSLKKKPYNN